MRHPAVRGGPWKTTTVRTMLTGTAVAGLTYRGDELITAPWPAILDRGTWDRLRALFADPAPAPAASTAREPKWLVSVFARCGVCQGHDGRKPGAAAGPRAPRTPGATAVTVAGTRAGGRPYRRPGGGAAGQAGHQAWRAAHAPASRYSRRGTAAGREEEVLARLDSQARKNALGQLSDRQLAAGHKAGTERIAVIDARLAAAVSGPDPVPEFRGDVLALQAWEGLTVARRRAVVQALVKSVTIMRALPGSHVFDPSKIVVVAADGVPWPELAAA